MDIDEILSDTGNQQRTSLEDAWNTMASIILARIEKQTTRPEKLEIVKGLLTYANQDDFWKLYAHREKLEGAE